MLYLPYFNKLYSYFQALAKYRNLRLVCERQGNELFSGVYHINDNCSEHDVIKRIISILSFVERIRFISEQLDINPIFPEEEVFYNANMEDITILYHLLKDNRYTYDETEFIVTTPMLVSDPQEFVARIMNNKPKENLTFAPIWRKFKLFEEDIDIGPLANILTEPQLLDNLSERLSGTIERDSVFDLHWKGKEFMIFRVQIEDT